MAADNALSVYANESLNNLETGLKRTLTNGGNLIVYLDITDELPTLLHFKKTDRGIKREVIKTYNKHNSASEEVLSNVFRDAYDQFPANEYGLIFWGHGSGWMPSDAIYFKQEKTRQSDYPTRWIGQDQDDYLDIPGFRKALKSAPYLEFIVMDACLMGNVEVAYELTGAAKYLIASPTEIHADGMPYDKILTNLFDVDQLYLIRYVDECVEQIVNKGKEKEDERYSTCSMSLIDLREIKGLRKTMLKIIANHQNEYESINSLKVQPLDRMTHQIYFDLEHLFETMNLNHSERVQLEQSLAKAVIYKKATEYFLTLPLEHFCGLSCSYYPSMKADLKDFYEKLSWKVK
ncbi:MAG: clostripain-related cysteine peptidase [Bacteroidales bacterium]